MAREDLRNASPTAREPGTRPVWLRVGWTAAITAAVGVRAWNAAFGPLFRGYDDHGHVAYILFLDLYHALPWADQGWSYFHPPLHYLLGWGLAQFDSPVILMRGLAWLGGLWSLLIAGVAAHVTRRVYPERPGASLLAFVAVSMLPVYLYTSAMAGNELLAALLGSVALWLLIGNEFSSEPSLRRDAGIGLVLGLALLTKVTASLVLAAVGLAIAIEAAQRRTAAAWRRAAVRGLVLGGIALAVAAPYYARNWSEFGTPLKLSRDNPHVLRVEEKQKPGSRSWIDFVAFPPSALREPDLLANPLLHSVWGSVYAQMWADMRPVWDGIDWAERPHMFRTRRLMLLLGLAPTLLALTGGLLATADAVRGRRRPVYVPLLAATATSLAAFVYFSVAAPQWSALKASYLLGLTLPYALFVARSVEWLRERARSVARAAVVAVAVAAAAAAFVFSDGVVLPRLGDAMAMGALAFHFGDRDGARALFEAEGNDAFGPKHAWPQWRDNLADIALLEGDPLRARELYRLYAPQRGEDPFRWNATGAATALVGRVDDSVALFDAAVEAGAGEVALSNRGVANALLGNLEAAEADLRAALTRDPQLAPAWQALAVVLGRAGRAAEAAAARAQAVRAAGHAPRGHPYGIPDGLGQTPSWKLAPRWLLWMDHDGLRLARAPFRASDAVAMRDPRSLLARRPHLALVVLGGLRADRVGAWGYDRAATPQLDRLAADGVRFANAYATAASTLPSVVTLFTGRLSSAHGVFAHGGALVPRLQTLAGRLQDAGYWTVAVTNSRFPPRAGLDRGFDVWSEVPAGGELAGAIASLLPSPGDAPLFLFVHREVALEREPGDAAPGDAARGDDGYDAAIAAADADLGATLRALSERGFADRLVVVATSDRGRELGEHGGWGDGRTLFRESVEVPLVIRDERAPPASRVVEQAVDLLDVPITLLSLAGVAPGPEMAGRDLLGGGGPPQRDVVAALDPLGRCEQGERPCLHRGSLLRGTWKLVLPRQGAPAVFDLAADPEERHPLALADRAVPAELRASARILTAALKKPPKPKPSQYLPLKMRARLRAMAEAP